MLRAASTSLIAAILLLAPALSRADVGQPAQPEPGQQTIEGFALASGFALSAVNTYKITGKGSFLLGTAGLAIGAGSALWASSQDVQTDTGRMVMVTGTVAALTGTFALLRAYQTRDFEATEQSLERSAMPHIGVGAVGKSPGIILRWRW